jgi:uncharacterized protein (TIGR02266 family)
MGDAARKRHLEVHIVEARRVPRASAYVCVDVFSDQDFWTGVSLNLSEGGVFVATHHMAPIGSTVVLHMLLPFEQEAIVTLGDVRWTREQAEEETGAVPGLGIEFVGLSADALSRIRRFVAAVTEPLVIA